MKTKAFVALSIAVLMLAQGALAKGPPQKLTISGAGLAETIEITDDQATLEALGTMVLEDYTTRTSTAPQGINGEGTLITRYYVISSGDYFAFDELIYYPDSEGGRGYIHYLGIVNGSSEYDGDWFRANADSEVVLVSLIDGGEREAETAEAGIFDAFIQAVTLFVAAQ